MNSLLVVECFYVNIYNTLVLKQHFTIRIYRMNIVNCSAALVSNTVSAVSCTERIGKAAE